MVDITKTITPHIQHQFPAFYKENGEQFIAFVEAYYEWLEQDTTSFLYNSRIMYDLNDIDALVDNSLEDFIWHFKEKYLVDFPFVAATDKAFMVKHIMDYHRSKGSPNSLKLLMRLLYNENATIYYPSSDMLRASDSEFHKPVYIEVTSARNTNQYINKQVTGTKSGAVAFIEGIVRKRVKGKIIDVLYLSNIKGVFLTGDIIVDVTTGQIEGSPKIKGSLSSVEIEIGGQKNRVGDVFDVVTEEGVQGQMRVTEVEDGTGRVEFKVDDPGYGYTAFDSDNPNSFESTSTNIYVADAMLFLNNTDPDYRYTDFETVYQPLETVTAISATQFNANASLGDTVFGISGADAEVAEGSILGMSPIGANTVVTIQVERGTFLQQVGVNLTSNSDGFLVGETVEEESSVRLNYDSRVGDLTANDVVEQFTTSSYGVAKTNLDGYALGDILYVPAGGANLYIVGQGIVKVSGTGVLKPETRIIEIIDSQSMRISPGAATDGAIVFDINPVNQILTRAYGLIESSNSSSVSIKESWGEWKENLGADTAASSFNVTSKLVTTAGARGEITATTTNGLAVLPNFGEFTATKKLRGSSTGTIRTIATGSFSHGATDLKLNDDTLEAVITEATDSRVEGIVVAQDNETVGVYGNNTPFFFVNPAQDATKDFETILYTDRAGMYSPPRFSVYKPEFDLEAPFIPPIRTGFLPLSGDADSMVSFFQSDAAKLRANDFILTLNTRFNSTLADGVLFELGGNDYGVTIATGTSSADSTKKTIWFVAGEYLTAANQFKGEIPLASLPTDGEFHKISFIADLTAGSCQILIDDARVMITTVGSWNGLNTWLGIGTAMLGGGTLNNNGVEQIVGSPSPLLPMVWEPEITDPKIYANEKHNSVAVPGAIIELNRKINRIAGGQAADFKIGVLEGTEDLANINVDLLGSNNVIGIPYMDVGINGTGSGIGFVDSFTINSGGTGYSAGQEITLAAGGRAGGVPIVPANVTIESVSGTGVITDIIVNSHGAGYYTQPTFTLPTTTGTVANVDIEMNYGYGFPRHPNFGVWAGISDTLSTEDITIGKIGLLSNINPGSEYTINPFIRVINHYISSYDRHDISLIVDNITGGFAVGDSIEQNISGNSFAKGTIKFVEVSGDSGIIKLNRSSFGLSFAEGVSIRNTTFTGNPSTANVVSVSPDKTDIYPIGADAIISGTVINAAGVATGAEIISSGFGYIHDDKVIFQRADGTSPFIITGKTKVEKQGLGLGYWKTTSSHLSSEKKLQDNDFYQNYSYQVQTGLSMNIYHDRLKSLLHVAGTDMFSAVIRETVLEARTMAGIASDNPDMPVEVIQIAQG